jgi:protein-tyrosine phosphatase
VLGVPREVVMQDYLLTNEYLISPARVEAIIARGGARESAMTSLSVDRAYLESLFQAIDTEYGSFDRYRRTALGVSDADLAALKAKLLE